MDIFIPIMLCCAVIGGALFFEFGYPRIKHRRQLENIRARGAHRILTADERNALSRYLSLSPTQYRQLLGSYVNRNDGWTGDWSLIDDHVYGAHVVFEVKSIERLFIQNRFGQAGALRFNILPFWEQLEGIECTIEFVLTDKLPVIVSVNNHSLREGMQIAEHFLDSEKAVNDFNCQHNAVGRSSASAERVYPSDEAPEAPTHIPVEGTYLPAATDDNEPSSLPDNTDKESHSIPPLSDVKEAEVLAEVTAEDSPLKEMTGDVPSSERNDASNNEEADIVEKSTAAEDEQQTGTADDTSHAQHDSQHENARLGNEHVNNNEHDISGVALINVRHMSREEAKHYYGPKCHRILGSLALILCALLTWSGGSNSDAQDAFSVLLGTALVSVVLCWVALPLWLPRTQIKTVQGPLVLGHFHPQFPTLRSLGIGNLRIHLREIDMLSDDDIGRVMNVDLTPNRDVIAIDGTSVYTTGTPYRLFGSPKFLGATLLALLAVLFCNPSIMNVTRYLRESIQGPRHVALSTLAEAEHYQPIAGDVLDITGLPVLCELDNSATPDCNRLRPGLPSAMDLSVDRARYQALAKIEQRYSHIRERMTNDLHYNSASREIEPSYDYIIPDAKSLIKALTFFKKEMDPEEYEIVTTLLSSRFYAQPIDKQHTNDIVLKNEFGAVTKHLIRKLLEHENDNNQQRIQSIIAAFPASKTPWFIHAINDHEQESTAMPSVPKAHDVLHMMPAFEVPEETGYRAWDRQVDRLAHHFSGTLTVSGQVTDITQGTTPSFALQCHYREPTALWRIISLVTLAMLAAAACGTALCVVCTRLSKAL